ncbi:MAG: right-handed parallel beta-helix repeat-containing protein [Waterburya sp.]
MSPKTATTSKTATKTEDEPKIINVDRDFKGNLENAIAAAKDGDLVQLGNDTYYTEGIRLNKDITIDGQKGSVIDGGGTSESIFYLTASASGATIQDVEITNGNNGIFAEGASNLTLQNLDINNIGINQTIRNGPNNTGIILSHAEGLRLLDSKIHNIGRKAVGIENTDGGIISGLSIEDVNLRAQHTQSHDAAGIKFFNTNDITVKDSYFSDINGISIWNDTNNSTTIENNVIENVGEDFLAPSFNQQVDIFGIYDEKSYNSVIKNNEVTAIDDFSAFRATEFSGETMTLEDNNFSSSKLGTTDYWVNELAEKLVALTEDPDQADFSLFAEEYSAYANIGD